MECPKAEADLELFCNDFATSIGGFFVYLLAAFQWSREQSSNLAERR
jgi:hypothetical protein